jgi:uncharacterized protein YoxC
MNTLLQSQVFFFISSLGFVSLWILVAVFLYYLISVMSALSRIIKKVEKDINNIGDTTKEMLEEMRNNVIFSFLFGKKKRKHKEKNKI